MSNLTRNEIIELLAVAFHASTNKRGVRSVGDHLEASLKALEKAGVLMLVEEGNRPKEHDLLELYSSYRVHTFEIMSYHGSSKYYEQFDKFTKNEGGKVIQRANTPVYQCKPNINNKEEI